MFHVNDTVTYGAQSVCKIIDITEKSFRDVENVYYVLQPIYDEKSTIFVPVENEVLTAKMRPILSAEEIHRMIRGMPDEETSWIENETQRKDEYRKILAEGNRAELIKMIKALYLRGQNRKAEGKKLSATDERFLKDAEKILYDEFALVLHLKREQVLPFIIEQLGAGS